MKIEEFKARANVHQTHMESLVFLGEDGLEELNDKIEGLLDKIDNEDNNYNVTQKIDGAPAILIGHSIAGYPEICVGIKSLLTNSSNALSSVDEIEAKYSDRPLMASMLKYALELAPKLPRGEVWQGDCLFTHNSIKTREIKGKEYLTFQPNKIIYAFSEDNKDYNKVANADFGIAFHTIYTKSGEGWKQSFRVNISNINIPDNIYVMVPTVSMSHDKATYNVDEIVSKYENLKQIENTLISNPNYEVLVNNQLFMKYWNTFENANLSDKKAITLDLNTFYNDLIEYIEAKHKAEFDKKLSTLKTDSGKLSAQNRYDSEVAELEEILDTDKELITNMVKALNLAAEIKMNLYRGLIGSKQDYNTFLKRKSTGDYIDSEGEGISLSDAEGNIVKLVDRSTFSSANRDPDIESGFEHESLEITENLLCETSTSRIYNHIVNDNNFAIISGYTGLNDTQNQADLKKDVKNLGYGFIEFKSSWANNNETYQEESLLIPNITKEEAILLGKKYNQISIIVKDNDICQEINVSTSEVLRVFDTEKMNITMAQEIIKNQKGAYSVAKKGSNRTPFTLKTVEELSLPRPSMFHGPEYFKIYEELNKGELPRVWQKTQNNATFAIIGSQDKDTKEDKSKELLQWAQKMTGANTKCGYKKLKGSYTYADGSIGEETSIIISNITKEQALKIANQLNQECIIWKDINFFGFLLPDGTPDGELATNSDNMTFKDVEGFGSRLYTRKDKYLNKNKGKKFAFKLKKEVPDTVGSSIRHLSDENNSMHEEVIEEYTSFGDIDD